MSRLFVAIWPDASVIDALSRIPRPETDGVRWSPPDRWHVTLRFVGEASVDDVVERLADVELPSAALSFGPRIALLGDRVVVVPVAGADELAAVVRESTAGIGEPDQFDGYRGHLTLARIKPGTSTPILDRPFDATMTVGQVALVQSTLTSAGAKYETVAKCSVGDKA